MSRDPKELVQRAQQALSDSLAIDELTEALSTLAVVLRDGKFACQSVSPVEWPLIYHRVSAGGS